MVSFEWRWPHLVCTSCQISSFLQLECERWFHPQEPVVQLPVPGELVCQVSCWSTVPYQKSFMSNSDGCTLCPTWAGAWAWSVWINKPSAPPPPHVLLWKHLISDVSPLHVSLHLQATRRRDRSSQQDLMWFFYCPPTCRWPLTLHELTLDPHTPWTLNSATGSTAGAPGQT